jgi:hypothetical protein
VLKVEWGLIGKDRGLLLGRQDASADIVEAVPAVNEHHDGAGRSNRVSRGKMDLVRSADDGSNRTNRGVEHHDLSVLQAETLQILGR